MGRKCPGKMGAFARSSCLGFFGFASIVIAFSVSGHADTGSSELVDRLASRLGASGVHVDHVILLDHSGSMVWEAKPGSRKKGQPGKRRIDVLTQALPGLLEAVEPGDYFVLVPFAGNPIEDPAFLIKEWEDSSAEQIIAALRSTKIDPAASTDIASALDLVLEKHLIRGGANPIQFVYLLTDGEHDPPQGSPFPKGDTESWKRLGEDYAGVFGKEDHTLFAYMFGLYDVADTGVVRFVLPDIRFLRFSGAGDLRQFFQNEMSQHRLHRIEALARKEIRQGGVEARLEDKTNEIAVTLVSHFRKLPVEILLTCPSSLEGKALTASLAEGAPALTTVSLAPGKSETIVVPLCVNFPEGGLWRKGLEDQVAVSIPLKESVGPKDEFEAAGLASIRELVVPPVTGSVLLEGRAGSIGWLHVLAGGVLLGLLVYGSWCLWPAGLSGKLIATWQSVTGLEKREITLKGRTMSFGAGSAGDIPPLAADSFELMAARRLHRKETRFRILKPSVNATVAGRKVPYAAEQEVRSAVAIKVNNVTCRLAD